MEFLDIYDENGMHIGTALRSEVHQQGLWHHTFHCWIMTKEKEKNYLLFQIRQRDKDLFPSLLDISAAGHILAGESIVNSSREIEEELGIVVPYNDLKHIGVIREKLAGDNFLDYEFCNVFLHVTNFKLNDFIIQEEELSGLVKIELTEIINLFLGNLDYVHAEGFKQLDGKRASIDIQVKKEEFVPHQLDYYLKVFKEAERLIR
ncbi:NUDIX domain-containing protein [Aquibacillus halophilus]|uniref:NUDIX domain-containing protein n=1 Tax=Aquibacillus halophilus TaxID=930132 RepID=A0A6A8DMD4_9BACI|nr:NUDIX domain-containing protein [Aquibacillus halophilus]MRH44971.1 NUDIX domain-containing protein [Aquibacillus halophilus]